MLAKIVAISLFMFSNSAGLMAQSSSDTAFKIYDQKIPGTSIVFKMIPVPAGSFLMGSTSKEKGHQSDEGPAMEIKISAFWMEEHEVTYDLDKANALLDKIGASGMDSLTRDEKQRDLDATLAQVTTDRAPAAAEIPEDLMALYERLREQKGVGAAHLRARQCGGCQLALDSSEISRIRSAPADEVFRCEECQRILVRTDESGL